MGNKRCFVGFDGFTDDIVRAVKKRSSTNQVEFFEEIAEFSTHVNQTCNVELHPICQKIGGNGAIFSQALSHFGHPTTFAGTVGSKETIEPLFQPLARRCTLIPLGSSSHTDAIEFHDGKLILGKMAPLQQLTLEHIPFAAMKNAHLLVFTNWTMTPIMTDVWEELPHHLTPENRHLFVDLADPAKRTKSDLNKAIKALQILNKKIPVTLSLNGQEAEQISSVDLHQVLIHTKEEAHCGDVTVKGSICKKPKILTGAGDHFNAGFCHGLLKEASLETCLHYGMETAGHYVRHGNLANLLLTR